VTTAEKLAEAQRALYTIAEILDNAPMGTVDAMALAYEIGRALGTARFTLLGQGATVPERKR
jgi:hypothetical protein